MIVTHESVRNWCRKFGAEFARKLRRRRPKPGDTWHLDEVFVRIRGVLHYLWRAVDQNGVVLDILVQDRRNGAAAKRFFKLLLRGLNTSRGGWLPTACAVTGSLNATFCPRSNTGQADT